MEAVLHRALFSHVALNSLVQTCSFSASVCLSFALYPSLKPQSLLASFYLDCAPGYFSTSGNIHVPGHFAPFF